MKAIGVLFVRIDDDDIAAAVNGKTCIISSFASESPQHFKAWSETGSDSPVLKTAVGQLRFGDWFECRKDEIIDLDVLVREYPGNGFGSWLFIEKMGARYQYVDDLKFGRQPVLPVFQVTSGDVCAQGKSTHSVHGLILRLGPATNERFLTSIPSHNEKTQYPPRLSRSPVSSRWNDCRHATHSD